MDPQKAKKQSVKVIVSETIMVLTVIMTVVILALLVSGYWLNSDFEVEQSGMLQVSSVPTGATVEIDGEASSWLQRTNTSKVLNSGEHTIKLTKDGYDSWSKTIRISEGLLYRLHYPRLFPTERTAEDVLVTTDYTKATISSDHNSLLLMNGTTEWAIVNLDTDNPSVRKLDISQLFSDVSLAEGAKVGLFTGEILQYDWDYDSSHILFKVKNGDNIEWILLDVNNVNKSTNLTKEFGGRFSHIEIMDNNSNNLLAIQDGSLRQINLPSRSISNVIASNVTDFDHFGNEVVFSAISSNSEQESADSSADHSSYYIGFFKLGDNKITELERTTTPTKVALGKFYDSKYITVVLGNLVSVHKKDDYLEDVQEYETSFTPDLVEVGHNGEFLLLIKDYTIAALDLEATKVNEWTIENHYGWLDNDMLYTVSDGSLIVYDFDGLNRRILAHNASSHFPASVTSDKWLYYFSDSKLVREPID